MPESLKDRYTAIDCFTGLYSFLSNNAPATVYFEKRLFPSAACALCVARYQLEPSHIELLQAPYVDNAPCPEAQRLLGLGEPELKERPEWGAARLKITAQILRDKFRRNPELRCKLEETGDRQLIWLNKEDSFFGQLSDQTGQNQLGRLLMELRNDIRSGVEFEIWLGSAVGIERDAMMRPSITLVESKPPELHTLALHHLDPALPYWDIGKLQECVLRPSNPTISRKHALITVGQDGQVFVLDLKSTAGTYLNSKKLEADHVPYLVPDNSSLRFGTSARTYAVQIDRRRIVAYLAAKQRDLENDISTLEAAVAHPSGISENTETRVCIKNLLFKTTKADLLDFFQHCGDISEIVLPQPRHRSATSDDGCASCGIAFLRFDTPRAATCAVEKDGFFFNQRKIRVTYAPPLPESSKRSAFRAGRRPGHRSDNNSPERPGTYNVEPPHRPAERHRSAETEKFDVTKRRRDCRAPLCERPREARRYRRSPCRSSDQRARDTFASSYSSSHPSLRDERSNGRSRQRQHCRSFSSSRSRSSRRPCTAVPPRRSEAEVRKKRLQRSMSWSSSNSFRFFSR